MAQKEYSFKYKVIVDDKEVEKSINSIEGFESRVGDLKKELNKTPLGSQAFKNLQKELKRTEGAFEKAKMKNQGFTESLAGAPGIMGQVGQGIKGISTAFKALLANPIVLVITAVVAAFVGLVKVFTSTKAGGEKVEQLMAGIGATIDVLRDRALKLIGVFGKLFSGDFKGALNDTKEAFSGIGDEIQREFTLAMELKKTLQSLEDQQRELNKSRAEQNRLISEAKQRINDENLSYEERLQALDEVGKKEQELADKEAELARQRYEAIKAQNALSDSSKEALDAEAQAFIEMNNKMKESADKQKEIADQRRSLYQRQRAEEQARIKEREDAEKAYNDLLSQLNLEQIEDAKTKEEIILQNELDTRLESIENLKISEEKKQQLRLEAEESYNLKKKQLDEKTAEEEEKSQLEIEKRKITAKLEVLQGAQEKQYELIKESLRQQMELELQNEELLEEEKEAIRQKYAKMEKDLDNEVLENKKQNTIEENRLEQERVAMKQWAVDQVISVFGAETAAGKAALIAKQVLNAQELIQEVSRTIAFSSQALSRSTVAVAEGTAQTAKVGFPQNIPLLIGYAAQAFGIIKAVRDAVRSAGGDTGGGGRGRTTGARFNSGGIVGGQGNTDTIPALLTPGEAVINKESTSMFLPLLNSINKSGGGRSLIPNAGSKLSTPIENQPIKAYVVSSEVTNSQQLERKTKFYSTL